jgi:hypothetical protein
MDRKYAGDLPSAKGVSVDVISSDPRTEVSITTPADSMIVALVTKFACSSDIENGTRRGGADSAMLRL